MQSRTERRLGFAAAIALTTAAFVMPAVSSQMAQDTSASEAQIRQASADSAAIELRRFVALGGNMAKPVRYE